MQLKHALFRYGWDTRCRNLIPARILRSVLANIPEQDAPALLDVGCGEFGLADFLPDVSVIGVDIEPPQNVAPNFSFQIGSVADLPFPDCSFPVVSCVDVLEHLSPDLRERAVSELTRVASRAVLIACPHGHTAHDCDEDFRQANEMRGRSVPSWVSEHLRQLYPLASTVIEQLKVAASASGRIVKVSLSYNEPASICRLVRGAAVRSSLLYASANLLLGALLPLIPAPNAENSYRMVILAELSSGGSADETKTVRT